MRTIRLSKLTAESCVLMIDDTPQVLNFEAVGDLFAIEGIPAAGSGKEPFVIAIARTERGIFMAEGRTADEAVSRLETHGREVI